MRIHNKLIKRFIELNQYTEAPELFLVWSLLGIASACAAREVSFQLGDTTIWPNQMILLVGKAGGRKSTVINTIRPLIPSYVTLAPNELEAGSNGLVQFMAGITNVQQKRLEKKLL